MRYKYYNGRSMPVSFWVGNDKITLQPNEMKILDVKLDIDVYAGEVDENVSSRDKIKDRLAEIKMDLEDDGKLNYSNNPDKKSPGRPKKQ